MGSHTVAISQPSAEVGYQTPALKDELQSNRHLGAPTFIPRGIIQQNIVCRRRLAARRTHATRGKLTFHHVCGVPLSVLATGRGSTHKDGADTETMRERDKNKKSPNKHAWKRENYS